MIIHSHLFQSSSLLHNKNILLSCIITFSFFVVLWKKKQVNENVHCYPYWQGMGVLQGHPSKLHVIHGCPCAKLKKKNRSLRNRHKNTLFKWLHLSKSTSYSSLSLVSLKASCCTFQFSDTLRMWLQHCVLHSNRPQSPQMSGCWAACRLCWRICLQSVWPCPWTSDCRKYHHFLDK